jgi:hypothetical protein
MGMIVWVITVAYILAIFFSSGKYIYTYRRSVVDLDKIIAYANQFSVKSILEYEPYGLLPFLVDNSDKEILKSRGITTSVLDLGACPDRQESHLLIMYRDTLEHGKPFPVLSNCQPQYTINMLEENRGHLDLNTIPQSIYFPLNGMFIYLLQP